MSVPPSTMSKSLRIQRGHGFAPARDRPNLHHRRCVPDASAANDVANIACAVDGAVEKVHTGRVHDEVRELAGRERADRVVDAEGDRGVEACRAKDLWGG